MSDNSEKPFSQLHERQLAQLFQAGKIEAFDEIARRYEQRLYEIAMALLSSNGTATHAVQHTLHSARNTIHEYNYDSLLFTWLSKKLLKYILLHHLRTAELPAANDYSPQLPEEQ